MSEFNQTPNPTNDVSYDDITAELMAGRTNEPPANPTNEPPVNPPAPATPPANQPPANTPPADPANPPVPANEPPADPNAAVEKDWYEEPPANEPAADPNAPQNQAPQVDPLYAKYADVLADPDIQYILDLKKAGKTLPEIQKEIAIVDFDAMTPAQIQAHHMRTNGATEEDIADYIKNTFDTLQPWEQNEKANTLKPFYKSQQDQRIQNNRAGAQKMTAEQQAAEQKKIEKTTQELQDYAQSLIGKKKFGIQLTEADVTKTLNRFFNGYPEHKNPDGTPNVQKIMDAAFVYDNIYRIGKALEEKFLTKGARQVAETVNNASKQIPGSTTHVNSQGTIEDAVGSINPYLDK